MIKLASPSHYQGLQKAVKHNALMVLTVSRSTINTSHCTVWRKVRVSQAEAAIEDIALVAAFAFVDGANLVGLDRRTSTTRSQSLMEHISVWSVSVIDM
jgi:hypothetical protein